MSDMGQEDLELVVPSRADGMELQARYYDEMITRAGIHLFEAETILDVFVREVVMREGWIDFDDGMRLDEHGNEGTPDYTLKKVIWDRSKERVELEVAELSTLVEWGSLNILTKNLVANCIHIKLLSGGIYESLCGQ
jgi:hypothetical protein